jgi:hypothetical protein
MHRAQGVADRVLAGVAHRDTSSHALTTSDAAILLESFHEDARDAVYSGAISIAEAVQGLDRKLFTWATVKLYYSVFYLSRAALGLHGVGIMYRDRKPYAWVAATGERPTKLSGTTHKAVLDAFRLYRKSSVLTSQQIGTEDPFAWLMARRESANYKNPKFCEPGVPPHFNFIEKHGVRRPINDYIADDSHLFTFDPDHAMLAFPIAALKLLFGDLRMSSGGRIPLEDATFLASQVFDTKGPLPAFQKLLLS